MGEVAPLTGELQTHDGCRLAIRESDRGAGAQRAAARYRGAYNTIQTVLNRLADRKLLSRHKVGNAFEYRPLVSEADISPARSHRRWPGPRSPPGQAALAQLIGRLDDDELTDLRDLAREMNERRRKR